MVGHIPERVSPPSMPPTIRLASILALFTLVACSDDKPKGSGGKHAGKVASCNMPTVQMCVEYRDANLALGTEMLERLCTGPAGSPDAKFTASPCPTEKVIGTCKKNENKDFFYEGFPMPIADVEADCKRGEGAFSTRP